MLSQIHSCLHQWDQRFKRAFLMTFYLSPWLSIWLIEKQKRYDAIAILFEAHDFVLRHSFDKVLCIIEQIFSSHIKLPKCLEVQTQSHSQDVGSWHIFVDPSAPRMDLNCHAWIQPLRMDSQHLRILLYSLGCRRSFVYEAFSN